MNKIVKVGSIIGVFLVMSGIVAFSVWKNFFIYPTPTVKSISLDENNQINVEFTLDKYGKYKTIYCLYAEEDKVPTFDDKAWFKADNYKCKFDLTSSEYKLYLKNQNNDIFPIENDNRFGYISNLKINKEKVYVAAKAKYTVTSSFDKIGYVDETTTWTSDDETIATVDENGVITGVKAGETKVHVKVMDEEASVDVLVTNLLVARPKTFNSKKSYLPCGKYSKEDNDLIDTILVDRMNDVGYPTRASAVEAARFITLELPYKIRYFSENGRGSTNGIDGEGRYYHKGLYLDESRFAGIGKKMHGPATWGCPLYSNPSHGSRSNGLDCSGFITWVMYNGGWDVKDVGAGLAPHLDMTDYGIRTNFNADVVKSGKVKVGDLLSSGGVQGGHIAMIVGIDENNYYVAESLWTPPNVAVGIYTYSKKTIFNRYYYVMLMDSYYKEDGKITDLWY